MALQAVATALQLQGGGIYEQVGPGQGTDDTEMALSLAHALVTQRPPCLPLEAIARSYCSWASHHPMDMGEP